MKRLFFRTIEIETEYGVNLTTRGAVGKYQIEHSIDFDAQFHCLSVKDTETGVVKEDTRDTEDTSVMTIDVWNGECHVRANIVYLDTAGWCVFLEGN